MGDKMTASRAVDRLIGLVAAARLKPTYGHILLVMIDEFPALVKLDILQEV
jgi:type IV secretory pathway TraG/TraD family ATPase VirD4